MPHFHQILAIILAENIKQQPSAVTKETKLGHLAAFFRGRQELGLYGRMAPNTFAVARGGPAVGVNPKAVRPADPQYRARKTMAEDLKNAKLFLQQGLLMA